MYLPLPDAPIVLVHGLCGFSEIRVGSWTLASYFRQIPDSLRRAGYRVLVPGLSPTRGVADRAAQLKAFLDREAPREAVHLFAHSMGGLDARYMISRLGMAGRVLSLTTLGTPHRGTPFADWGLGRLRHLVKPLLDFFGIPTGAFYDLSTAGARRLSQQMPDAPGVRYFSVAGRLPPDHDPQWLLSHTIVAQEEGPNDGLVSVASAQYGESLDVWEGDHLSLVGWLHHLRAGSPAATRAGSATDPVT
jgi:triacylglycerol lipase